MSNWFTKLNRLIGEPFKALKAKRSFNASGVFSRYQSTFGRMRATNLLKRYKGWLFVVSEKRANAIASLDWTFMRQTGYGSDGLAVTTPLPREHWLVQLWENPTGTGPNALEWITAREILRSIEQWRSLDRGAYLWTPDGADGAGAYPLQMYVLPPHLVRPVGSDSAFIEYYELQTPKGPKRLSRREVCWMPCLAPGETLSESIASGYSKTEAATDALDADEATIQFVAEHFRNGAIPPMVIEEDAEANDSELDTPEKYERWLRGWLERLQGNGSKVPLAKLPQGWRLKIVDLVSNLKGMMGIADKTMEIIAQVWGVPLSMLKGNAANFATARVDNYILRVDTIEPEAYTIEAVLTRHFRKYDPNVIVAHIPAIDEDPEQLRANEVHRLETGRCSVDDLRRTHGELPIGKKEGGELVMIGKLLDPLIKRVPTTDNPNELSTTVGGEQALILLQEKAQAGLIDIDAARANLELQYGKTPADAKRLIPDPKKDETVDDPIPTVVGGAVVVPVKSLREWSSEDFLTYVKSIT